MDDEGNGCMQVGRTAVAEVAKEVDGKTLEEVEEYSKVFWKRHKDLNDWERIIKNIERGEGRIQRQQDIMTAIASKLDRYRNPWQELKLQYGANKGKAYTGTPCLQPAKIISAVCRRSLCLTKLCMISSWAGRSFKLERQTSAMHALRTLCPDVFRQQGCNVHQILPSLATQSCTWSVCLQLLEYGAF